MTGPRAENQEGKKHGYVCGDVLGFLLVVYHSVYVYAAQVQPIYKKSATCGHGNLHLHLHLHLRLRLLFMYRCLRTSVRRKFVSKRTTAPQERALYEGATQNVINSDKWIPARFHETIYKNV
jgi:hypothetical protein